MKTLILNGSPRIEGDASALVEEFVANIEGDVKIMSYYNEISPCIDCRYCWENNGCSIPDDMQEVYSYLKDCDNVVIASPIWYSSLTGPLLNIASRIQSLFTAKCMKNGTIEPTKNGVLILVGAAEGTEDNPTETALAIMRNMLVRQPLVSTIYSMNTLNVPAHDDEIAKAKVREAAQLLNSMYHNK